MSDFTCTVLVTGPGLDWLGRKLGKRIQEYYRTGATFGLLKKGCTIWVPRARSAGKGREALASGALNFLGVEMAAVTFGP